MKKFPKGFLVGSINCGIKKNKQQLDLCVLKSNTTTTPATPTSVYCGFTQNKVQAAPVIVGKTILSQSKGNINGLVVNSGCANACTGEEGINDVYKILKEYESLFNSSESSKELLSTLMMSTGVIGQRLDTGKILKGLQEIRKNSKEELLGDSEQHWIDFSKAFMTTDTFPKLLTHSFTLPSSSSNGKEVNLVGVCKGAGMICPNMATMLAVVCSDVSISNEQLESVGKYAMDRSFNCITVDGDTSTNDMYMIIANGASGVIVTDDDEDLECFRRELTWFSEELAKMIIRDGEGMTKFVTVNVKGCSSRKDAKLVASTVCNSLLVKTALYGQDANWGRIVAAVGRAGVEYDAQKLNLYLSSGTFLNQDKSLHLVQNGEPYQLDEAIASSIFEDKEVYIGLDLGEEEHNGGGGGECTMWTCDLSHKYVDINASYRT